MADAEGTPAKSGIGCVTLRTADLAALQTFYSRMLGFQTVRADAESAALSAGSGGPPVILLKKTGARQALPGSPGLFHVAILYPSRAALGTALRRLVRKGYQIDGAADHLVSHALYLADPEGNGVELYCDLPRDRWPWREGELAMATEPLDVNELFRQGDDVDALDPRTTIGHVHLQVSQLQRSGEFYRRVLGLDITQGSFPGALFLSTGGYHHHVGLNIWRSRGASAPPPDSPGLESFSFIIPTRGELDAVASRASAEGLLAAPPQGDGLTIVDPDGIRIQLTAAHQR